MYLLSDFIHDITEGVLPGIHLDHSDTHNHLIHHFDTFIRNTCCFESENEKGILMKFTTMQQSTCNTSQITYQSFPILKLDSRDV